MLGLVSSRADFCSVLSMLKMAFCFDEIESHGNYRLLYMQISLLCSPCTKRMAFFLSELEAKLMSHCTGRGKKLHIHI